MAPSRKSFGADRAARRKVELKLVVRIDIAVCDRPIEIVDGGQVIKDLVS
jgi:hypothetical protein